MDEHRHDMTMADRSLLRLTGVVAVDSSEEEKILLKTVMGQLVITGEGLHICRLDLDSGNAEVGGRVDSLAYPPPAMRNTRGQTKNRNGSLGERLTT